MIDEKLPIYRAKKIDSDEYVVGFLIEADVFEIQVKSKCDKGCEFLYYRIDPSTLAIHFPDMLASDSDRLLPNGEKDLRIFASLSEDGKGGDIVVEAPFVTKWVVILGKYYEAPFDSKRGDKLNRYGFFVEANGEQKNINSLYTVLTTGHTFKETNERVKVTGIQQ